MIAEIGHFALIIALILGLFLAVLPVVGAHKGIVAWIALAKPLTLAQFLMIAVAYAALTWSFLAHDFSVAYVAHHSNTLLPTEYLISGVWGGHEGSLLLWALMLSLWAVAVSRFSRSVPESVVARVLGVMGMVSIGFLLFMLLTSNPFDRLLNPPAEGRDLNPLLQDPGLIFHPPLLYMGYVGLSVVFAFAIAAMLGGRLDAAWARWSRPWTNVAWGFLTLGIGVGSWWAYYELGWGGWWFWDPVENASLMPWLVATALMHSLAVTEKRGAFKAWTVLLAISAFSLSLLGAFLVRSGVLTSVHAFATDPDRGVFILIFLLLTIGGSLLLYSWRAPGIRSPVGFRLVSREAGLLLNNLILVVITATVLLGTIYPLILDALGLGKISVGPPYFNAVFVPIGIPLMIALGVGVLLRWKQDSLPLLLRKVAVPAVASLVLGTLLIVLFAPHFHLLAVVGLVLALWVIFTSLLWLRERGGGGGLLKGMRNTGRGGWGMIFGHLGVAIFVIGMTMISLYDSEQDLRMEPGQSYTLAGYTFTFQGTKEVMGPNYKADRGILEVTRDGREITTLYPEKRDYFSSAMPMTEAGIQTRLFRDLFVALGEPLGQDGAWSVRLYHKPFVVWLWAGGLLMAFGGMLAASDRRYFRRRRNGAVTPPSEPPTQPVAA